MKPQEAFNSLDPGKWAKVSLPEKLALIEEVQRNLHEYAKLLGETDALMKDNLIGQDNVTIAEGMGSTVVPMANTLIGIKHLYESLIDGEMPEPIHVAKSSDDIYEVQVYPKYTKDRIIAQKQRGYLHIVGKPKQVNHIDKPAGIVAISGAGNYSSSIELPMALFLENKAVIHKPHALNVETEAIWTKIFDPLVKIKALAFCDANDGKELVALKGLSSIYFTGSTRVADAIQKEASAPVVSECGGNNPCIIVPGNWSHNDLKRQAIQIVSAAKLNGGAVCGRPQTIVMSKEWEQREDFMIEIRRAIQDETFAVSTYYPNSDKTKAEFLRNQPTAEVYNPEDGALKNSDFVFIPNIGEDDYATKHEAFCQILSAISLDVSAEVNEFLKSATDFCNNKLFGTLGCMILIDNDTMKDNKLRLAQAIKELNYGGIAVNDVPPDIWLNPYLTWGGCGETPENLVSGIGNFGNAFNFENVKKSVLINDFEAVSYEFTNRRKINHLLENMAYYSINQSWIDLLKLIGEMMIDEAKKKDF